MPVQRYVPGWAYGKTMEGVSLQVEATLISQQTTLLQPPLTRQTPAQQLRLILLPTHWHFPRALELWMLHVEKVNVPKGQRGDIKK